MMIANFRMTCRDVAVEANAHLEGDLDPFASLAFRGHLLICRNCRAYVDQMRQTVRLLGQAARRQTRATDDIVELMLAERSRMDMASNPSRSQGEVE